MPPVLEKIDLEKQSAVNKKKKLADLTTGTGIIFGRDIERFAHFSA